MTYMRQTLFSTLTIVVEVVVMRREQAGDDGGICISVQQNWQEGAKYEADWTGPAAAAREVKRVDRLDNDARRVSACLARSIIRPGAI